MIPLKQFEDELIRLLEPLGPEGVSILEATKRIYSVVRVADLPADSRAEFLGSVRRAIKKLDSTVDDAGRQPNQESVD